MKAVKKLIMIVCHYDSLKPRAFKEANNKFTTKNEREFFIPSTSGSARANEKQRKAREERARCHTKSSLPLEGASVHFFLVRHCCRRLFSVSTAFLLFLCSNVAARSIFVPFIARSMSLPYDLLSVSYFVLMPFESREDGLNPAILESHQSTLSVRSC